MWAWKTWRLQRESATAEILCLPQGQSGLHLCEDTENESCSLAVHGRILPFVYYIFNAHYLCCLVTLKHSNAVFKNTFFALPCTLYSKRSTQGSSAWQHRAGHWWFLTPRRTHWPSEALSCCYLLWKNSSRVCSVLSELPQNHSRACLMKKAL